MTFLNPTAFWFFLILLPLIAVYLLRIRPELRPTTALFLWEKIFQEKRSSALFRRLRDLLSLLLLLLVFIALILVMAGPVLTGKDEAKHLVLLLDNSASMGAGGGSSRLDEAKKTAGRIIRNLGRDQQVILATAARKISVVVNATSNLRILQQGIEKVQQSDLPFIAENLTSLISDPEIRKDYRFILISDACFERKNDDSGSELLKVGKPEENLGICAFDLQILPGRKNMMGLFFQLVSSFQEEREIDVLLCHENPETIVKVCPVTLKPGINPPEVYDVTGVRPGKYFLQLDLSDANEIDNRAFAVIPELQPVRIGLKTGKNSFFFRNCIESFAQASEPLKYVKTKAEVELVLGNPAGGISPRQIIFRPEGRSVFWKGISGEPDFVIPRVLLADHPALRFVDLNGITFAGVRKIIPPENAVILVRDSEGIPLLYKTATRNQSAYVVNMDPEESDFFLSIYFPVLIYSMALDLTSLKTDEQLNLEVGELFHAGSPPPRNLEITDPKGENRSLSAGEAMAFDWAGFYRILGFKKDKFLAVSLRHPAEGLLDNSSVKATVKPIRKGISLTELLLMAALLILILEEVLYHRRKVG